MVGYFNKREDLFVKKREFIGNGWRRRPERFPRASRWLRKTEDRLSVAVEIVKISLLLTVWLLGSLMAGLAAYFILGGLYSELLTVFNGAHLTGAIVVVLTLFGLGKVVFGLLLGDD